MSRRVYGVTGLPCAGKSVAARWLAEARDGRLIQADELGHEVLLRPEVAETIARRFGSGIVVPGDSRETRRRIAGVVFSRPAELSWLESLVHPLVAREVEAMVAGLANSATAVVEAALLFAAGMERDCDRVLIVEADFAVRLGRAARRGWDREELERRDRRLAPLFSPPALAVEKDKIVTVRNDADDGRLGERIAAALQCHEESV